MQINRQILFWLAALAAFIAVLWLLQDILLPFVAGIIIAYFLDPIADRLVAAGFSRTLASIIIVGLGGVVAIGLILWLVPVLFEQAQQLAQNLPEKARSLKIIIDDWARTQFGDSFPGVEHTLTRATDLIAANWTLYAKDFASSVWQSGLAFVNFMSLLLVTPLVVFYILDSWEPMLAKIDGWLPRDHAQSLRHLAFDMNNAVAAFVRGQGIVCLILGAFYATALHLLGLKYGLVIGLLTGLFAFVPFVGWAMGLLTALGIAALQPEASWVELLKVGGVFVAGMALDSALLSPKIVGEKIGLHPVWLIFALFVFSYFFGFVGMLVAVPVAAAVAVLVRFALSLYLNSAVYRGAGAPPGATA
jgi:predicted PurR-regulated permease PerM